MEYFRGWLLGFFLLSLLPCRSQWEPAGLPYQTSGIDNVFTDTLHDAVYFCGETYVSGAWAISKYQAGAWYSIGSFQGRPRSVARMGDTLFVGGSYPGGNGMAVPALQCMIGEQWVSCGSFEGPIYRLKVINGDLYAIGAFTEVDGQSCQGVAKRVNGQWAPVGTFDVINSPNIQDLVEWNGTLYATGTIRFGAPNPKDVAYLTSTGEWLPLGPGIRGGFGAGRALAVYNNELYVSGSIPIAAGNAGHGIMRWDGQQFHPVGTGFQTIDGTYTHLVGAIELEVYDDKLWACGTFSYAGNVPCPGIAYWDGERWCGLPAGIQPEINSIEFFHDTLFASCNNWDINCAMRFTGSVYSDTCSVAVSVEENAALPRAGLRAYRGVDGLVTILGVGAGQHRLEVLDAAGRSVHSEQVNASGDLLRFALPPQPPGVLMIRVGSLGVARFMGP
jgi:hypothetical protein